METEWVLTAEEQELLKGRSADKRLGFALSLKYFQRHHRFPTDVKDFTEQIISAVAAFLETSEVDVDGYFASDRLLKSHRHDIRCYVGFRPPTNDDAERAKSFH